MKLENMDLEQMIDNGICIGEHMSLDDILDNVVEGNYSNESDLVLNEAQATKVIKGLINDSSISDDFWEEKVQHIRDDFCFNLEQYGVVDVVELADFHGPIVYQMVEKYL
jgi:hypothetical protein